MVLDYSTPLVRRVPMNHKAPDLVYNLSSEDRSSGGKMLSLLYVENLQQYFQSLDRTKYHGFVTIPFGFLINLKFSCLIESTDKHISLNYNFLYKSGCKKRTRKTFRILLYENSDLYFF